MKNTNSTTVSQLYSQLGPYQQNSPDCDLSFDWSYGYKGNESRNNLYFLSKDKIVYFVAAVGIVYEFKKQIKQAFIHHTDDILSLALHPNKQFVATGQKKDLKTKQAEIVIWNSEDCQIQSVIKGSTDNSGFCALAFSPNAKILASANLTFKNSVSIWNWVDGVLLSEGLAGDRILDLSFTNVNNMLVSCGVRNIKFWTLRGNTLTVKPGQFGKDNLLQSIFSIALSPDGIHTYAGTSNGDIYVFKDCKIIFSMHKSHESIVLSISSNSNGFISGSKDGTVKIWEHSTFNCVRVFDLKSFFGYPEIQVRSVSWDPDFNRIIGGTKKSEIFLIDLESPLPTLIEKGHGEGELWGLSVHPLETLFATGSDDGLLVVWNWYIKRLVQCQQFPNKIRSVCYSNDAQYLACGTIDGSVFVVLSESISNEKFRVHHRKECIQTIKFSPNDEFMAVGSNDNFVDIYAVLNEFALIGTCKGSSSFITHLDWNSDSSILQTNSGARERLFYQITSESVQRIVPKSAEINDILWFTCNTLLSEEVSGIWQKYQVLNDINNIDTNFRNMLIATGDDDCKINLYNYPVFKKGAKSKTFIGHASHVTNVKFSHDLSVLFTLGGGDHTILQWKLICSDDPILSVQDSDAEFTRTDTSDLEAVDSDLENEKSKAYLPRKVRDYKRFKLVESQKSFKHLPDDQNIGKSVIPSESLILDYVHGYRGYDCRDNLFYSAKGEIIFHIAALGIVYDKNEKRQRFYTKHTDDILCLDMHPGRLIVATGQTGAKPPIHIWEIENMQTLSILQGSHTRGISAMDFSCNGEMLASIGLDDDHTILIHNWKSGQLLSSVVGHKDRIFMIRWNLFEEGQLVTVGVKHIKFWVRVGATMKNTRGSLPKDKRNTTFLSVAFSQDMPSKDEISKQLLFTGGSDGNIYIWEKQQCIRIQPAHEGPIYSLISMPDACLSGGKDGKVVFWNENMSSVIRELLIDQSSFMAGHPTKNLPCIRAIDFQGNILVGTKENEIIEITRSTMVVLVRGHSQGELWGLAHDPNTATFATVSDDSTLRIWNMDIQEMMYIKELPCGARVVSYSNNGKYVVVGLLNGKIMFFNSETMESKGELSNRSNEITVLKFSPDDRYLAAASKDREVDIYSTTKECRVGIGRGSSATIVHLDWDISSKIIRINSMSREVLYFEAPRGKRVFISKDNFPEWKTYTCTMSADTKGVWYEGADITDVNSLDCHSKRIIATGDDLGFIRLYNYPSYVNKAKHKKYVGHSAHVTNVRFSNSGSYLVSLGGNDTSILIWKVLHSTSDLYSMPTRNEIQFSTEDEGGYDSYVDWEVKIDYEQKTYSNPMRSIPDKNAITSTQGTQSLAKRQLDSCTTKVLTKDYTKDFNSIKLEYVFGFRGFDCRSNLKILDEFHILFNAAAVGIVMNINNNTQWFYDQHNDDILSLALIKNQDISETIVATGQIGKEAAIHVWKIYNADPLSILTGAHSKGICSLSFSHEGHILASVGIEDSHAIAIWNWKEGTLISKVSASHYRIFHILCIRTPKDRISDQIENLSLITCGISHIKYWNVTGSNLISERLSLGLDTPCETILSILEHADGRIIIGGLSGYIYIFKDLLIVNSVKLHNGPIWSLCIHSDGILSGSRGSSDDDVVLKLTSIEGVLVQNIAIKKDFSDVRAIDYSDGVIIVGTNDSMIIQIKEGIKTIINQGHGYGELWGLTIHPNKMIAITASHDSCIISWDLTQKKVISNLNRLPYPVQCLDMNQNGNLVAAGFCNGQFTLFELEENGVLKKESAIIKKRDYSSPINIIKFSPDGSKLAVVCTKNFVGIYKVPHLVKHATCQGFKGIVSNLDWSQDSEIIQINTLLHQRLIYQISNAILITDDEIIAMILWSSLTCVNGPDLKGIWSENAESGDINNSALSNRGNILATGDDYGLVKLFNFPVNKKNASFIQFHGHSAHVTNLKFTFDDQYLVTTGGDDSCVFLWKTVKEN